MHLFWFLLVNVFENCGLNMQYIFAPNIILGKVNPLDPDNTNNQVILILKYYLYKCRCLGDKPSINGGLKYCIKIEKTTINFLSPTQKEYICKNVCHLKQALVFEISVQCRKMFVLINYIVCAIFYMHVILFLYLYPSMFFFKHKQITTTKN